ncbi:MAG: class D sortase [Bryobacteraceae bacterium]
MPMEDLSVAPIKPGLHSYNARRKAQPKPKPGMVTKLRLLLFLCGIVCIGFYGYSLANEHIYQVYENWAFDQEIAGRTVTFVDWLRERTPLGAYMTPSTSSNASVAKPAVPNELTPPRPLPEGALVGKVVIPRLNLSAIVLQGVEAETLARGAGHVPSTAMPGQTGNFAIAAHRDTLFRPLRNIKKDDDVTFESPTGSYTYRVVSTQIVLPSDVEVLRPLPDGGKWLTLITCYPFYYVGSAPKRFIVQAKLVSKDPESKLVAKSAAISPPRLPTHIAAVRKKPRHIKQATLRQPRRARGFSASARSRETRTADTDYTPKPKKHHGFWHRLRNVL